MAAARGRPAAPSVWLQPVDEPTPGKNRGHPDLSPDGDGEAEVERLLALGARRVEIGQTGDEGFVVLADPEGNEFCVFRKPSRWLTVVPPDPLPRLRALCLALPEATEKLSHGEPTWFVRKVFVTFAGRHHDDRVAFWCAAPPGVQEALVGSDPLRFFRPPYVGGRGWLGVYLDVPGVDWAEIAEIVADAYREVAPKRLAAQLDARQGRPGP